MSIDDVKRIPGEDAVPDPLRHKVEALRETLLDVADGLARRAASSVTATDAASLAAAAVAIYAATAHEATP